MLQYEGRNSFSHLERQFCELPQVVPVEAIMGGVVRMSTWSAFPVCCRRPVAWRAPEQHKTDNILYQNSYLSVFVVVLALQMECVFLDLRVTEGLQDT